MAETQPIPADLGEQTKAQTAIVSGIVLDGLLWADGGTCANPLNFPRDGYGYRRGYWTYRWMLQHPVIRHVRQIATAPVIASTWDYKKATPDVPDARVELVRRNLDPLRRRIEEDALRGRDYGWAGFEPVWDSAGGEYRLECLKPLSHDATTILIDDNGNFAGLAQGNLKTATTVDTQNGQKVQGLPAPYKAWLYTYDRESGNLHGRSWLENIRETAWKDWLDAAQQLAKLSTKIAGTQAIIKSPEDKKDASIALIKALANGAAGGWLPSLISDDIQPGQNIDMWKLVVELSKSSLTTIDVLDFGSTTAAITGLLERMKHAEGLMFEGGLRSPRSGREGEHGTKAEAGIHTDTGVISAELDDDDIAQQLQPVVDALLVLNYGPDAAGTIRIDPPPLVDDKADRALGVIDAVTAKDTPVARAAAKMLDWERLFKDLDAPLLEGAKFELEEPQPQPVQPPPAPPTNGNGRVNGKANGKADWIQQKLNQRMGNRSNN